MWCAFLSPFCQLLKYLSSCHSVLASLVTFLRKSAFCALGTPCYACVPGHCSLGTSPSWSGIWKITEHAVPLFLGIYGGSDISSLPDVTLFWMAELRRKVSFLLSGEQSEFSLACCHNRVHLWDNALTCEERLVPRSSMRNVSVWHCPSNASAFRDPPPQRGAFYQLGRSTEEGDEGTGKDVLTALRSSLLWILWAEVPCKSFPAEPSPEPEEPATAYQSSCFTLEPLSFRSSWNDHKETTIHHDPAGKTVPHTGDLNVVKCSSPFAPCPKKAV